jgi:hypothetical protein
LFCLFIENYFVCCVCLAWRQEVVLQDVPRWKAEDGTQLVGGWDHVTHADFSHNFIKELDDSIVSFLWFSAFTPLSKNAIQGLPIHLQDCTFYSSLSCGSVDKTAHFTAHFPVSLLTRLNIVPLTFLCLS